MTPAESFAELVEKRRAGTLTPNQTREIIDEAIARETAREDRQRRAAIYAKLANACLFIQKARDERGWQFWEEQIQRLIGDLNGQ